MARERVGVVLLLPPPLREEVQGLRRALGDPALERVAPHLTLVPPVNVREADMPAALRLLRDAAAGVGPFSLDLGPVATFWPETPVLYLEVGGAGTGPLERLRSAVWRPPLQRVTGRPFVPHVTVCDDADPALLGGAVAALSGYRAEMEVGEVHLLREGKGREWSPIAGVRLGGRAVVGTGGLALELTAGDALDPEAAAWAAAAWGSYGRDAYGVGWVEDRPVTFTARREGKVVGVAEGSVRAGGGPRPVLELSRLIVGRAERSQGVGSHLLARVCAAAAESGCAAVRLRTLAGGPAESFYRCRGFAVTARLPAWREGRDFVVMERGAARAGGQEGSR